MDSLENWNGRRQVIQIQDGQLQCYAFLCLKKILFLQVYGICRERGCDEGKDKGAETCDISRGVVLPYRAGYLSSKTRREQHNAVMFIESVDGRGEHFHLTVSIFFSENYIFLESCVCYFPWALVCERTEAQSALGKMERN